MKREKFQEAGRLKFITYTGDVAVSIGERGYARIEVRPTAATLRRLEGLADRRFGSKMEADTRNAGIVYRGPWEYLWALWRTQMVLWRARRRARRGLTRL